MTRRAKVAAGLAVAAMVGVPLGMSQGGGSIDVFVGSTPTPTAAPSNTANLWIDSNGGTCTFNASAVAYTGTGDSTSCASTSAAYSAANTASASASTVAVRAGTYGDQTIPDSTRTGGTISFVENNGDVTFSELVVHGDKTAWTGMKTLKQIQVSGDTTRAKFASFTNWTAEGGGVTCPTGCDTAFYMYNAEDITFSDGEVCCGQSTGSVPREAIRTIVPTGSGITVDRLTIENSDIHDWDRDAAGTHSECALLLSIQGLTVRNNHFWNCTVYSVSLARQGGTTDPDPSDTLIENNLFEPSDDVTLGAQDGNSNMVLDHVNTRFNNLVIRNNSFSQNIEIDTADVPDATGYDQTKIYSNILPTHGTVECAPAGMTAPTYVGNVLPTGASCGSTRTNVATPVNLYTSHGSTAGTWDFHLQSGSAAIGVASSTAGQFSTADIGGFPRDGAPDAGAYEWGSGS